MNLTLLLKKFIYFKLIFEVQLLWAFLIFLVFQSGVLHFLPVLFPFLLLPLHLLLSLLLLLLFFHPLLIGVFEYFLLLSALLSFSFLLIPMHLFLVFPLSFY